MYSGTTYFPKDLSDRCDVLSPGNRRWFHGDRSFHPRMGWSEGRFGEARHRFIVNFKTMKLYSFSFPEAKKLWNLFQ